MFQPGVDPHLATATISSHAQSGNAIKHAIWLHVTLEETDVASASASAIMAMA